MYLGSGARVQRWSNGCWPIRYYKCAGCKLGGSLSVSVPWIRVRCYTIYMLPFPLLPVVEHCVPHPATKLTNGVMRSTNSCYVGYCNSHHLPGLTDLVIVELDTEDEPYIRSTIPPVTPLAFPHVFRPSSHTTTVLSWPKAGFSVYLNELWSCLIISPSWLEKGSIFLDEGLGFFSRRLPLQAMPSVRSPCISSS